MAEKRRGVGGKGSSQRSLSLSRKKRGDSADGGGGGAKVATITSFFSNVQPKTFACPLCGVLVPRFRINEHIDTECRQFQKEDNEKESVPVSGETPKTPPRNPSSPPHQAGQKTPDKQPNKSPQAHAGDLKTSPYFKKQQSSQQQHQQEEEAERDSQDVTHRSEVVRRVSLSSRLSRKSLKSPQKDKSGPVISADTGDGVTNTDLCSSQKENQSTDAKCTSGHTSEWFSTQKQTVAVNSPLASERVVVTHWPPATTQPQPSPATTQPQPSPATTKPQPSPATTKPQPSPATTKPQPSPATTKSQPSPERTKSQPSPETTKSQPSPETTKSQPSSFPIPDNSRKRRSTENTSDTHPPKSRLRKRARQEEGGSVQSPTTHHTSSTTSTEHTRPPCVASLGQKAQTQTATVSYRHTNTSTVQSSDQAAPSERTSHSDASWEGCRAEPDPGIDKTDPGMSERSLDEGPKVLQTGAAPESSDHLEVDTEATQSNAAGSGGSVRKPYYLRNFLCVLEAVLEQEDDLRLFNQDDLHTIRSFQQLSALGQMLYVRLFQRRLKWLPVGKLDYSEISTDLGPVVDELQQAGLVQGEHELQDLGEVLEVLPAPELRLLAKAMHVSGANSSQRPQLVDALLKLGRQRALFSMGPGTGTVILKRAKQLLGHCVRVAACGRAVFSRLLLLFSLTDTLDDESAGAGGQGQLYTILLVNSGRLVFPEYTIQRQAPVFRHRDDLIRYEVAIRCLQEVSAAMQSGSWEDALGLYTVAKATWQELQQSGDLKFEAEMPVFLRSFTVGWTYTRIMSRGVEILQRLRQYEEAVVVLRCLLEQQVYCLDSRGRWWDRLALNLQQHLKQHEQAIAAIRDGLSDPLVRTGHQLALQQRAARMKESPSLKKLRLLLRDLPSTDVKDVPHVTIRGHMLPHQGGMGKSVFLRPANEEEAGGDEGGATIMCSVEDLALAHYREMGYDQGLHGEGSTFSTLCGLLMWDVTFMDGVADAFRYPYQTGPLDLHTDCFYGNRREAVEARVQLVREASVATLEELLADTWQQHQGRVCVLVNWERFTSLQQAQSLVRCMGGPFLAEVMLRMAKDYRHCRGGLPDLVVWNTHTHSYKLVEVKGPNDRLSQKQQIWLDELHRWGADVEVCHVTAIGGR
ncbi:fanconi-associated nuclease 1 [Engraulis encrasicolus]|uniref:fanconi-associated nuclease 1 n=1 Tax=Engraulis encrasicolus TaxID=184585 RepID=UPI002FD239DA